MIAEKSKVQHWPSPWPYDFPVDGEAQSPADKVGRLAVEETGPPIKFSLPKPPPAAMAVIGLIVVLGAVWWLLPGDEVDAPAAMETKSTAAFGAGVHEKYVADGIWLVNTDGRLIALACACTHDGHVPVWDAGSEQFKCDCGSRFYMDGTNAGGPAKRPLERFRIYEDPVTGKIVVDKSTICSDPASFDEAQFHVQVK